MLGVLVEKQHTVPDSYPLSLNALMLGCNQKTARDPVINATEAEVLVALDALKALSLVVEVSGSRVSRYEHNMKRVLGVPGAVGGDARAADAARAADGGRTARQHRAAAPLRRHLVGRGLPRRTGGAREPALVVQAAARARRARTALGAPAVRPGRRVCARRSRPARTTSSPPARSPRSRPSRRAWRPSWLRCARSSRAWPANSASTPADPGSSGRRACASTSPNRRS